jgi:hypothetical protein
MWQKLGRAMLLTVEGLAGGVMVMVALTGGF